MSSDSVNQESNNMKLKKWSAPEASLIEASETQGKYWASLNETPLWDGPS